MSARKYTLVLYGASGCVGAHALEQLVTSPFNGVKFAIAGRSESKMRRTLSRVSDLTKQDLTNTPIIVARADEPDSLADMARQTSAIVNTAGPYRLHGEPLVRAAADAGTHHVDISGEPAWQERMAVEYGERARESGACIVNACGFGSLINELGVLYLREQAGDTTISHAETFAKLDQRAGYTGNAGSYQTILLSMAARDDLAANRRTLMPQPLQRAPFGPPSRSPVWYDDKLQAWITMMPTEDRTINERSQYHEATANSKYPPNIVLAALTVTWFGVMSIACRVPPLLALFQQFPLLVSAGNFSNRGPSRKQIENSSFEYYLRGYGWPSSVSGADRARVAPAPALTVCAHGPDSGYVTTSRCALAAALTLAEEGARAGGVFTPAIALRNTRIYERLQQWGVSFRVVNK